ncbi:hypothetical protein SPRG_10154, partial [Saprolegnia parasitica CBS 223.65]
MPVSSPEGRAAVLEKAAHGIQELINWAQQTTPGGKFLPKTTNWTFEACRFELDLSGVGTFDELIQLYKDPSDTAATLNYVHVDKSQELFPLNEPGMDISLRWGFFRAPLPFMRDRSATYIEYTKEFTDRFGRRGFARYIRSHALGAVDTRFVHTEIRSWGVVIVETATPSMLHVSSTVDIDWNGNMPSWVATMMTSRRAQSIKALATVLRTSKKIALKRCGICFTKPSTWKKQSALVTCYDCDKLVCIECRSIHSHASGVSSCWGCVSHKTKLHLQDKSVRSKSAATGDSETPPPSCMHKSPPARFSQATAEWYGEERPTNDHVDLSYLPTFHRHTTASSS